MNILFVDLEREWRGGQSQAFLTLRGLKKEGHDVALVAPNGSPLAESVASFGIPVHRIPKIGMRLWAAFAIRSLLQHKRFDLIHLNEPHALTSAWFARAHRKLPMVLSRRIGFPLKKTWIAKERYGSLTRFLANCKDVERSLLRSGVAQARIAIVNEGVEVPPQTSQEERAVAREIWKIGKEEFLFGCVGVFVPEKGQHHLIGALAILRKQFPHARLLLAGDGKCRGELQELTREFGQTDAVIFAGFLKDVKPVYAALDAFVFPSEFEGLGTALQSAMALGLPCVSTTRGGLSEVVENERTVLVAEPNAKDFAVAMMRLIADEPLREKLGQTARTEIQKRFSDVRMVKRTIEVYQEVCSAK
ncbi:MAG TPA: glycosyltransferase family 4 protein [Candidatus Dormibacteraeota bacterium]|jgi:glycosyltransferase involved in cell wall biosynthesis|nr:glycosyltransferase family 4 protein [Candidatus Dormibacteraeota bacterium]